MKKFFTKNKVILILATVSLTNLSLQARQNGWKSIEKPIQSDAQKFNEFQKKAESSFRSNNINKSIEFLFKAKDVAEKMNDPEKLAQSYGSIANQYSYLNLTEKAKYYLQKAQHQIEKLPQGNKKYHLKALTCLELGNLAFNDKKYETANQHYRQAEQEFRNAHEHQKNSYNYQRALYNIGNSYYYLNRLADAENYLQKALKSQNPKFPNLKPFIYSTLAEVATAKGQYSQAINVLQSILKQSNFNNDQLKMEMYLALAKNYKKIGDEKRYMRYTEKHLQLRDAGEQKNLKAIGVAMHQEQIEYKKDKSQNQKNDKLSLLMVFTLVVIGLIIGLIRREKKAQQKSEEPLALQTPYDQFSNLPERETVYQTMMTLPETVELEIITGLKKFEEEEKFRNPNLTAAMLAVSLNTNATYLTIAIKKNKGTNFNNYLNQLRINYICQKIQKHPEYSNYKISYLAEDCGFISHSTFSTIFKKVTGIPPSEFLAKVAKNSGLNRPA